MNVDDGSSHGPSDRTRHLRRIASLLPLATVAAWVITIFVPILDSGNNDGPRIRITSLGEDPFEPATAVPGFFAVWLLVVVFSILPLLFGISRWWSGAAMVIAALLIIVLVFAALNPPSLLWDGQTPDGMPTGGMEVALPDFGFFISLVGALALGAAGSAGWSADRSRPRRQP
ncbi:MULTISPECIES: hypothetical protein [Brevibacterium]|uniref:Uncharacterized protein n=1 Tax=Brevibacterium aurantiacum TaxID=273384 RepID=A0A3Q8ST22_BREAU|nr:MULTISPECIES: hypothetical protein [Brevibacterium]AZL04852.1 hypothetical protein CXR24_03950 [Brevibacterium aurantiacum]AZL12051.1 hypothetical protein CXR25_03905 [Brevibacterium aurantiacum]AZT96270.1 hypothetical protein CXR27_04040 [Brevibacterium aurantiacum]RCS92458.1 hypothetical protein CIK63_02405 [Brevibacterium aurantiacum]WCE40928.1 hypothetical protein PGC08_04360 [Brevibacterium sp. BDJS002]